MNEGMVTCGRPSRGRYVQGCRCYMCRVTPYAVAKDSGIPLGTIYSLGAREKCTFATYDRLRRSLARLAESARSTA